MDLADAAARFVRDRHERGATHASILVHTSALLRLLSTGAKTTSALTPALVHECVACRHLKTSTQRCQLAILRSFLRFCRASGWVCRCKAEEIVMPRPVHTLPRSLTESDLRRLLSACKPNHTGVRDRALVLFLVNTCCRVSEALRLRVGDLHYYADGGDCVVMGKGRTERLVGFNLQTAQAVRRYLLQWQLHDLSAPLWWSQRGPMTGGGVRDCLDRLGQRAGVGHVYPHMLRHTGAILLLAQTHDLAGVQQLLGHTTMGMTQHYARLADGAGARMARGVGLFAPPPDPVERAIMRLRERAA